MRKYTVRNSEGESFEVREDKLTEAEQDGFLPVVSNGEDEQRVRSAKFSDAEKDGYKPLTRRDVSQAESLARGALQSATLGFADEITAGVESLFTDKTYDQSREESRQAYREAQEANPGTYTAGQLGGTAATFLVPGLGVAKGASLAGRAANMARVGAVEGAAFGAGASEADLTRGEVTDLAKDVAIGAGMGAITGAGGELVSTVGGKAYSGVKNILSSGKPVESTVKVAANLGADLPEPYSKAILDNPGKFRDPKNLVTIQDEVVETTNKLRAELGRADTEAWNKLSAQPTMHASNFDGRIDDVLLRNKVVRRDKSGELTPSKFQQDKHALRKVQEIRDEMRSLETLSERDLKSLIQKIDAETDWDKQDLEVSNKVLQALRGEIDGVLKMRNESYRQAMEAVAPKAELLTNMVKEYRLKQGKSGYEATDTTLSKLKNLTQASGGVKRPKSEADLRKLSEFRSKDEPLDFVEDVNLAKIESATEGGATNGSRNTLAGTVFGGVLGGGIGYSNNQSTEGALAGAALGFAKDKYGRRLGKYVLEKSAGRIRGADDLLSKIGRHMPTLPEKQQRALQAAMQRGTNAVSVTHYLLQQQDPEYRRRMREDDEE
jgi:hypothetical protein